MTHADRLAEIEAREQALPSSLWRQRATDAGVIEDAAGQPIAVLGTSGDVRLPVGEFLAQAPSDVRWLVQHLRDAQLAVQQLALASEFRVPLPQGSAGGYAEVVAKRDQQSGRWAVTDGSFSGLQAWVGGEGWRHVSDVGRTVAFRHTLDEALLLAHQVAELEAACYQAEIAAARRESTHGPTDRPGPPAP